MESDAPEFAKSLMISAGRIKSQKTCLRMNSLSFMMKFPSTSAKEIWQSLVL
ncbi:hypothetical protein Pint_20735 [Pistacia integerrima]|uniref:Uncharacterized protein n=1 Tax=Pistacia integerrima TaxID=434235 RepID=A0ACC0XAJ6_9ROSI|nr:hypothetical protein Pint_20735 [Pistacia integerrima]